MILALDIGGTFIKWAAAEGYDLKETGKFPTPQDSLEYLTDAVKEIMNSHPEMKFEGLAVSYPGMEDPETGYLVPFGALTYGLGKPVRKVFEATFGLPVSFENDGRLAAYAESRIGNLQGIRSGYVLVIGTGIGGAYVRNGRIEAGSHGYGGQISLFLTDDIRRNGLNAIWSAHCGMPGFLAKAKQRMQKEDLDGEILMKLVREKDEQACGLLDEYMNEFTNVLFTLQMVLDPERFVIGGGISRDDLFIESMRNKYEEIYRMYSLDVKHADIMPCRFHNTSNIMGALALYYDEHQ